MSDRRLTTPVVLIVFNRPDVTERVFAYIRQARPSRLLLIADGPRPDRPGEAARCAAARAVVGRVDWPCEVLTQFSEENLGCRRRVSSGLDWVFQMVEEAIILEDDCLPDPTFFRFCGELLERYRDNERVMMISGDNFHFGHQRAASSYYFSRYCHIWGWATWRRAWRHYDVEVRAWDRLRSTDWLRVRLGTPAHAAQWAKAFDAVRSGALDTWDHQWTFACWLADGVSAMPGVNLVSNLGFGTEATHTHGASRLAEMAVQPMTFPLRHPPEVMLDRKLERASERAFSPSVLTRILSRLRRQVAARRGPSGSKVGES